MVNMDFTRKFDGILQRAQQTYKTSVNEQALLSAQQSLEPIKNLRSGRDLYEKHIKNAIGLSLRIGMKRIAIDAVVNNLSCKMDVAMGMLDNMERVAIENSFLKTSALAIRIKNLLTSLKWIYAQSDEIYRTYQSDRGKNDEFILSKAKEKYSELYKECEKLPSEEEVFEGVLFPNIKAECREFIDSLIDEVNEIHKKLNRDKIGSRVDNIFSPIPQEWKTSYSFRPTINGNNNSLMVVVTPFKDEFTFLACSYAQQNGSRVAVVDITARAFGDCSASEIKEIFNYVGTTADIIAITGMSMYHESNKSYIYQSLYDVARSKKGLSVLIHDFNSKLPVWKEAEDALPEAYDIFFMYLTLPGYKETLEALKYGSVREIDELFVKKECAFLGYVGVNEVIAILKNDYTNDFSDTASRKSRENYSKILDYITNLKSQSQLIGDDWGKSFNCFEDVSFEPKKDFGGYDYDTKRLLNPKNLDAIINMENILLPARCGLAVNYCLLCGEDVSIWQELTDEERLYRLTLATKTVGRLLNAQYDPTVEIKEIEGKAGAYCSGGGKLIVYGSKYVMNFSLLADAVCHEMFHAFQHTAMTTGWKRWHASELMVTPQRIKEWNKCHGKYIDINKNENSYYVQGFEVDARVFAAETTDGVTKHWQKLNLV